MQFPGFPVLMTDLTDISRLERALWSCVGLKQYVIKDIKLVP